MKEIVILSGKGGTGKTTVAAALAVIAGRDAVIGDCDVDAANMHLLLKPDFANGTDFYSGEIAVIDPLFCTSCNLCYEKCRFDAIAESDGLYSVKSFDCEGCGYCEIVCQAGAIALVPRKTGKVYISETKAGSTMVHATMEVGAENSGKLVAKVKREARENAEKDGLHCIIIDGSPGLGCPVVASLGGASLVVLVTEPTLSALHDLRRLNQVIKNFRIKTVCIINKHDLNEGKTREIKEFLDKEGIMHLADIPYYKGLAKTMAEALTMAETEDESGQLIREIWTNIQKELL
jgi:MinD superfamily P-loop ATPase